MKEQIITVRVEGDSYRLENSNLNDFELLGLLEQIVFDLKRAKYGISPLTESALPGQVAGQTESSEDEGHGQDDSPPADSAGETTAAAVTNSNPEVVSEASPAAGPAGSAPETAAVSELRTRIGNALKAIRGLGGKTEITDLGQMTEEELQSELGALTSQYKRLKASQKS